MFVNLLLFLGPQPEGGYSVYAPNIIIPIFTFDADGKLFAANATRNQSMVHMYDKVGNRLTEQEGGMTTFLCSLPKFKQPGA